MAFHRGHFRYINDVFIKSCFHIYHQIKTTEYNTYIVLFIFLQKLKYM